MTHRLRNDRDGLSEALEQLEDLTGVPYRQLEKDFWLTEALRGVAQAAADVGVPIFFKGGTSLSKVHGIIERFSEDVDVLVALPKTDALMSANQRAKALERLAAGAIDATGLPAATDPDKTRRGEARAVFLAYQDDEGDLGLAPLRPEGVLVELGRWGGSQPHETREVYSVLATHARELGLPTFDEQAPVTINVVDPSRTAVEKLMLLESAANDKDEHRRAAVARHYYDLWCLLHHEPTRQQLQEPDRVAAIAGEVFVHTHYFKPDAYKETIRERPVRGFSSNTAFDPTNPGLAPTREAYTTVVLTELLWPHAAHRPSFDDCCTTVVEFTNGL